MKKRLSNKELIQGFTKNGGIQVVRDKNESILDETLPEHFTYQKFEDSINEKRPSVKK